MNIAVAGTGYVGLVSGVCLAHTGHIVRCVDVDENKIQMMRAGKSPIYEEGLEQLMAESASRLSYTTDYASAYRGADVVIIAVGTPEKKDGSANLSYVFEAARQIAHTVERDCVVVVKSTVPIGTNEKVESLLRAELRHPVWVEVASNPEFLAQGTAIRDMFQGGRIVLGVQSERAERVLREMYLGFEDVPVLVTNRRSAEMIKYASNDFLALKLSYINEIANLCELVGADIEDVTKGMGYDERIGSKFLKAGIGYGGSCFPKDTKALHWLASYLDHELKTVKAAIEVNEQQKLKLLKKARRYVTGFEGLTVAVLGLTFKPGTDDLREAPSLQVVPVLLEDGARVVAWDPVAEARFRQLHEGVEYAPSPAEALRGADMCLILTEWPEVMGLKPEDFVNHMRRPLVLDGRNCYELKAMRGTGVTYESIGREKVEG